MGNTERAKPHFNGRERAQNHRRIDMPHMGDAEGAVGKVANADSKNDAAFLAAIGQKRFWIPIPRQDHRDRNRSVRQALGY